MVASAGSVLLAALQRPSTYPVGMVGCLAFGWLFVMGGLYAQAGLQVVYLALSVLGWAWWVRGGPGSTRLRVRPTPRRAWLLAAACAAVLGVLLWVVLVRSDDPAPVADAGTTATSLVAQLMLMRKLLGTWLVWIVTDVWLVGLYASQGLHATALLYAGFVVVCAFGWRSWRADLRRGGPAPAAPGPVGAGPVSSGPVGADR